MGTPLLLGLLAECIHSSSFCQRHDEKDIYNVYSTRNIAYFCTSTALPIAMVAASMIAVAMNKRNKNTSTKLKQQGKKGNLKQKTSTNTSTHISTTSAVENDDAKDPDNFQGEPELDAGTKNGTGMSKLNSRRPAPVNANASSQEFAALEITQAPRFTAMGSIDDSIVPAHAEVPTRAIPETPKEESLKFERAKQRWSDMEEAPLQLFRAPLPERGVSPTYSDASPYSKSTTDGATSASSSFVSSKCDQSSKPTTKAKVSNKQKGMKKMPENELKSSDGWSSNVATSDELAEAEADAVKAIARLESLRAKISSHTDSPKQGRNSRRDSVKGLNPSPLANSKSHSSPSSPVMKPKKSVRDKKKASNMSNPSSPVVEAGSLLKQRPTSRTGSPLIFKRTNGEKKQNVQDGGHSPLVDLSRSNIDDPFPLYGAETAGIHVGSIESSNKLKVGGDEGGASLDQRLSQDDSEKGSSSVEECESANVKTKQVPSSSTYCQNSPLSKCARSISEPERMTTPPNSRHMLLPELPASIQDDDYAPCTIGGELDRMSPETSVRMAQRVHSMPDLADPELRLPKKKKSRASMAERVRRELAPMLGDFPADSTDDEK